MTKALYLFTLTHKPDIWFPSFVRTKGSVGNFRHPPDIRYCVRFSDGLVYLCRSPKIVEVDGGIFRYKSENPVVINQPFDLAMQGKGKAAREVQNPLGYIVRHVGKIEDDRLTVPECGTNFCGLVIVEDFD